MRAEIKDLLLRVDKPARYAGGEFNTPVIKENAGLRFLMCFPDVYEVAHSNLGIKILYYMLNNR
ncbi:MAG: B12-binding domain-containing radical SAM protein, partial [Clostridiales bacterium]|nr:B12-binding domain-containing radical SAM protein [Clostridiales bacterium]